ncbi:CHAT domain-containing protein [Streptomyces sp. NPDC053493]|uniref:CHAT domain-containing protein n=1 Tax=Streptomyces sp. NPDC053493 TaxID=3365705 RepID=UPI0037D2D4C0
MMDGTESGGLLALQTWVTEATRRAARLLPQEGQPPPERAEFDRSIAELTQLEAALTHDEQLRVKIEVRRAIALALRYLSAGGDPEDRAEAQRLLRAAREPGAATDLDDRRHSAYFLAMLSLPVVEMGGRMGKAPSLADVLAWQSGRSSDEGAATAEELKALMPDINALNLPPEVARNFERYPVIMEAFEGLGEPGGVARLLETLPDDLPYAAQLRTLLSMIPDLDAAGRTGAGARPSARDQDGAAAGGPAQAPAGDHAGTGPQVGAKAGAEGGDQGADAAAAAAFEAVVPALLTSLEAFKNGDPDLLNRTIAGMLDARDKLPDGDVLASAIEATAGSLLHIGEGLGGNLVDRAAAKDAADRTAPALASMIEALEGLGPGDSVPVRVMALYGRLVHAEEAGDAAEVDAVTAELTGLEDSVPRGHMFRATLMVALAKAHLARAALHDDAEAQRLGFAYMDETREAAAYAPEPVRALLPMFTAHDRGLRAGLTRDASHLQGDLAAPPGATTAERWVAALSLVTRYELNEDLADLDAAIVELEHVRDALRRGERHYFAADALWQLAEVYQTRWARRNLEDQAAATAAAMEGLHSLAANVVLQLGSEHGLATARSGADRGVHAALWSAQNGRVEETVAALELGRALVLHSASVSAAVPELLEARGEHEIADAWRRWGARSGPAAAGADGRPTQEAVDGPSSASAPGLPRELPSTLRRKALEALGYRQQGALFTTPTVAELQAGLAAADADALFYLLPGRRGKPGMAVMVGPDTGTGVLQLPLLSDTESVPLDAYLEAADARSRPSADAGGAAAAEAAWEEALSKLLVWAYEAAVGDLISAVAQRLARNEGRRRDRPGPPRIVLVPCGKLGAVPWHAARLPETARADYACQIMVITYAASGGQFLRTIRRARRAPAAAPVLVADPRMDLTHAEREATALYESYYPRARLVGDFYEPPVEPVAAGTPDELLALLKEPLSLLHIASHGSAGTDPTSSALHLAFPEGTEETGSGAGAGRGSGSGAGADAGLLTVTRLLDTAPAESGREEGPLVVLSACQTDFTQRDHDEALTLTTAFVASGARDVVGSRWSTQDGASALMMGVFHHLVAVEGKSPADALHLTQTWMLDPRRKAPPRLSPELVREMERPGLDRPAVWAAFIHQGHPGPERAA